MVKGSEPKMGSTVVRGEVEATVAYTGINTFFGKTAYLLNVKKGMDHLQKTLLTIVFVLTILSIILCLTCFIYIWVRYAKVSCAHHSSLI
jgi:H+-transporting ATPase